VNAPEFLLPGSGTQAEGVKTLVELLPSLQRIYFLINAKDIRAILDTEKIFYHDTRTETAACFQESKIYSVNDMATNRYETWKTARREFLIRKHSL
jgi:hypothetical protein